MSAEDYIPGGLDPKEWFKATTEKTKETAIVVVGKKKKDAADFRTAVTAEDGDDVEVDDSLQSKIALVMQRVVETTILTKPLKKELIYILGELFRIYSPSKHEQPVVESCVRLLRRVQGICR